MVIFDAPVHSHDRYLVDAREGEDIEEIVEYADRENIDLESPVGIPNATTNCSNEQKSKNVISSALASERTRLTTLPAEPGHKIVFRTSILIC